MESGGGHVAGVHPLIILAVIDCISEFSGRERSSERQDNFVVHHIFTPRM